MEIFLALTGFVAGILGGWVFAQIKHSAKDREFISDLARANASLEAANKILAERASEIDKLRREIAAHHERHNCEAKELAAEKAARESLNEKLVTQKNDLEELTKKLNTEFENIANRILETKTEKFTDLNKKNLNAILEPLGKNIEEFRKSVNENYIKESKERFSLGEKVKELAQLNQQISDEARKLTRALKGEAKTQGCWGEMILETILEKSGLRRNEEYFIEQQLTDNEGNAMRSDQAGKKMRPDVIIRYPDNRSVIVDSKVSLNAFTRYSDSNDPEEQKQALAGHISAVKNHIDELSRKGYDDYDKALDFVMMFVPSEAAYIAALQGDPELWNYAYHKRVLLLNPTNLITSLRLIADLWKREYHNRNAQLIAERGAKLYDKFSLFVENLKDVGRHLDKAKDAYAGSFSQLSTGKDNLILQATKLKALGIKNKKELPEDLVREVSSNELTD